METALAIFVIGDKKLMEVQHQHIGNIGAQRAV
jgi:hypothetical protein